MLILDSTSDVLRVITSSTADLHCLSGFADDAATPEFTPGGPPVRITSATTTTLVAAPGSSVRRMVKYLLLRNAHASTANTITLQHYDGTNATTLWAGTLAAGESLQWTSDRGFCPLSTLGVPKVVQASSAPANQTMNIVVLGSDVTNNNGTANTIADVTGLSFSVVAGARYWFEFVIPYTSAATTTGSRWSVNGPASPTLLAYRSEYTLTATTTTVNSATAYDIPAASNASSLTAGNVATVWGIIQPSSDGTVTARFASEITASAIVAKAGATLRWMQVA